MPELDRAMSVYFNPAYVLTFALHTLVAYACALRLSQWLVFHWFIWIAPRTGVASSTPATDWYLQHFEVVTIFPALVIGYVNLTRFLPRFVRNYAYAGRLLWVGMWVWTIPTTMLLYKILTYHGQASVLFDVTLSSRIRYFFDIQKVMPTLANPLASDPVRVWAQVSVVGPFYAGLAYSMGSWMAKHQISAKLFSGIVNQHQPSEELRETNH